MITRPPEQRWPGFHRLTSPPFGDTQPLMLPCGPISAALLAAYATPPAIAMKAASARPALAIVRRVAIKRRIGSSTLWAGSSRLRCSGACLPSNPAPAEGMRFRRSFYVRAAERPGAALAHHPTVSRLAGASLVVNRARDRVNARRVRVLKRVWRLDKPERPSQGRLRVAAAQRIAAGRTVAQYRDKCSTGAQSRRRARVSY